MVTGSKHMLEVGGKRILLDCGMFQGRAIEAAEKNKKFPFDPASVDYIVLSHAHIDHSGLIPYIVKQGFAGKIICTYATRDLVELLLEDSAEIQEHDAEFQNQKRQRHGTTMDIPVIEPLYSVDDAKAAMQLFEGAQYETPVQLTDTLQVTFHDAGHILGSSIVVLEDTKEKKKVVFTGDLGRKGLPILKDPVQIPEGDVLITESTYGNRTHDTVQDMQQDVADVISKTVARGGKVIIPAFSVGRTQEMVYILHNLWNEGKVPKIPVYIDSPLSTDATEVFTKHPECYDSDMFEKFLSKSQSPFHFKNLRYVRTVEESKRLNDMNEPCIIISSSGMIESGRVVHHVKKAISDHRNTIMVIGYMAEGTVGRKLIDGESPIWIHGKPRHRAADVIVLNSFSAHADKDELFEFASNIQGLKKVFLVHGEEEQSLPYAEELKEKAGIPEVFVPHMGESFEL